MKTLTWSCSAATTGAYVEYETTGVDYMGVAYDFVNVPVVLTFTEASTCNASRALLLNNTVLLEDVAWTETSSTTCVASFSSVATGTYRPQVVGDFTFVAVLQDLGVDQTVSLQRNLTALTPPFAYSNERVEASGDDAAVFVELNPSYVTPCYTFPDAFSDSQSRLFQYVEQVTTCAVVDSRTYRYVGDDADTTTTNATHNTFAFQVEKNTLWEGSFELSVSIPLPTSAPTPLTPAPTPVPGPARHASGLEVVGGTFLALFVPWFVYLVFAAKRKNMTERYGV